MTVKYMLVTLALGGLMVGSAAAQNPNTVGAGPGVHDSHHPRVNQVNRRELNQHGRIAQGVRSGQLTPREANRLRAQEHHLAQNERRDMARDGGHLTKTDQAKLNRQANHVSRNIYRNKHNAAVR
jgi:hypothetical protein